MARKVKIAAGNNPQDKSAMHGQVPKHLLGRFNGKSAHASDKDMKLARMLDDMGVQDPHPWDLIDAARNLLKQREDEIEHLKHGHAQDVKFNAELLEKNAALMTDIKALQTRAGNHLHEINDLKAQLSIHEDWLRVVRNLVR